MRTLNTNEFKYVSGGAYSCTSDGRTDCRGGSDYGGSNITERNENNRISRGAFSSTVGDVGGTIVGILAGYSGIGVVTGSVISLSASKAFCKMGEYIYDNPESARHPEFPNDAWDPSLRK